ncbi:GTPase activating protein (GAP) for Rho1p [Vanrija albida]|uniref:GTPase activating protein (GAP) for Rho1p n=1 Tax=Vanrija albida TaxID=181172 RepID=A0ABR3QFU4_9TREE
MPGGQSTAAGGPSGPSSSRRPSADAEAAGGGLRRLKSPSGMSERERTSQGLMTWWKAFSQRQDKPTHQPPQHQQHQQSFKSPVRTQAPRRVFGAPLSKVLDYAGQQISVNAPDGTQYIWGEVPIVVGKCGGYLKQKTDIEGLFRVSGSEKRMRDLQATFDEGPSYGGDLDWPSTSYSPHDIATIFRRYLTQMPEPVVPHAFYDKFRNASIHELAHDKKLKEYKRIIRQMPKPNRALLLYVLDLLGTTARAADKNLMTAGNLAVIFQPGILHHPEHDLRPRENALSKDVLEFLIEEQQNIVLSLTANMATKKRTQRTSTATLPRVTAPEGTGSAPNSESQDPSFIPLPDTPPSARAASLPAASSIATGSAATMPGIPATIPEDGPAPQPAEVLLTPPQETPGPAIARPLAPRPKPVQRGDSGYMLPSDSDDEPPAGGYVMIESRGTSPRPPGVTSVATSAAPPASAPPERPPRSSRRERPAHLKPPSAAQAESAKPSIELLDPSDSDEEAPRGGYVVFENNRPTTSGRRTPLGLNLARPRTTTPTSGTLSATAHASSSPPHASDARANSPKPEGGAMGLLRRRTLPTKRVSDFTARVRRAVREA